MRRFTCGMLALGVLSLIAAFTSAARADSIFGVTNLTSDIPGQGAAVIDPNLQNPWGIAFSANSPFWISDQKNAQSTLYSGAGAITPLVVSIPIGSGTIGTGNSGPTGVVSPCLG